MDETKVKKLLEMELNEEYLSKETAVGLAERAYLNEWQFYEVSKQDSYKTDAFTTQMIVSFPGEEDFLVDIVIASVREARLIRRGRGRGRTGKLSDFPSRYRLTISEGDIVVGVYDWPLDPIRHKEETEDNMGEILDKLNLRYVDRDELDKRLDNLRNNILTMKDPIKRRAGAISLYVAHSEIEPV